jgi:Ras-related protein Rab-1A
MQHIIEYDYLFKVLLIGDSGVGKSSLLLRFTDKTYTDSYTSTIGVDFKIQTIKLNDKVVKLQLWDTCGNEQFRTITSSYYRNANGIFVVFDLTDKYTFSQIKMWLLEIKKYAPENTCITIIGNKVDLQSKRQISYDEAKEYSNSIQASYFETSAKLGININDMFLDIVKEILKHNITLYVHQNNNIEIGKTIKLEKLSSGLNCCQ